ncbi:hypothetical protein MKEN_01165400 [Mycena kentingensis (nom. inval.)]|nr:hypothetical protein MKEN_01165400 [Mycena kentingensis (nom. inval.)]
MADSEPVYDVPTTLGALLVGGSIALILSGILAVQCIVFFKLYPNDVRIRRAMVLVVWLLDILHSTFIVTSLFIYFIDFFGDRSRIDYIPWSIALSVVVTAAQTLIAHWYYAHKIYNSSGKNWWITAPIIALAFGRLLAASVSTYEMIHKQRYSVFADHYPGWVFTTGLSLSASVDVIITGCLCYFLRKMGKRTSSTLMARVVRTMTLYTLENGLVTCLAATASLICIWGAFEPEADLPALRFPVFKSIVYWLTMPENLIFLGLHFVIGKLYANSLLISLNTRKELREMRWKREAQASMWPVIGDGSAGGELTSGSGGGLFTGVTSIVGYGTGTGAAYNTYAYGVVSSGSDAPPITAGGGYHPAFKVPTSPARAQPNAIGIRVTRTVRRSSDDLSMSDVSRDEPYIYTEVGVAGRRNQFGAAVHAHAQAKRRRRSRSRGREEDFRGLP